MSIPGASEAVAARLLRRAVRGERAITVDQTNESVIVGEEVVVKWLRPPVPVPHPGVELLEHLAAVGFPHMPGFVGSEVVDELVRAVVTEYVPDALDGWDWMVDDIDAHLSGRTTGPDVVAWATRMGEVTADLHTALADMHRSTVSARLYHSQADTALQHALRVVHGPEGERLRALADQVAEALEPLRTDRLLPAHRIHGDLHAGNFLRAPGRFLVTDFDGNPLADAIERRLPQSPMCDLASLVQSIDHAGRIVVKRRHPDRADDVESLVGDCIGAAVRAYGAQHMVEDEVLFALRVAQELHEFHYAATHLPRWMYVPDAALPALLR